MATPDGSVTVTSMRRWVWRLLIAAILIAAGIVMRRTLFRPEPVLVEVVTVSPGRVEETVTNSRAGTVKARRRAKLSPEVGGQVVLLPFHEGDLVRSGEILLRIEDSLPRARLELSRRELVAVEAERLRACLAAERAGRELERTQRLASQEIVSTDLLDEIENGRRTADAACDAAAANVARANAAVALAATELRKTIVRAPFDGVLAEVSTEVGEWATPSPPALPIPAVIDILDPSSIYISAPMDEVDSARLRPGLSTRITVDSYRDRTFDGTLARIAPYVLDREAQNRTVEVEVELSPGAGAVTLLPGTSADVEIILSIREEVLRVPSSSLLEGGSVLVLADGSLHQRQIETGLRNWDYTEVVSGLAEGEQVVISLDRAEVEAGAIATVGEPDG